MLHLLIFAEMWVYVQATVEVQWDIHEKWQAYLFLVICQ